MKEFLEKLFLVRFHAPRLLLFMEARLGLAPRGFGHPHCTRLFFDSCDFSLLAKLRRRRRKLPLARRSSFLASSSMGGLAYPLMIAVPVRHNDEVQL
jgi:hypothetical protein